MKLGKCFEKWKQYSNNLQERELKIWLFAKTSQTDIFTLIPQNITPLQILKF